MTSSDHEKILIFTTKHYVINTNKSRQFHHQHQQQSSIPSSTPTKVVNSIVNTNRSRQFHRQHQQKSSIPSKPSVNEHFSKHNRTILFTAEKICLTLQLGNYFLFSRFFSRWTNISTHWCTNLCKLV